MVQGGWIQGLSIVLMIVVGGAFVISLMTKQSYTIPDDMKDTELPGFWGGFLTIMGFPQDWLYMPAFFYYGIIPMAGVWLILYGFLDVLRIFRIEWVNMTLALAIALSTVPLGAFVSVVSFAFGMLGVYATFMFVILAVAGVGFISSGLYSGWKYGALEGRLFSEQERNIINQRRNVEGQIDELKKQIGEWEKLANAGEVSIQDAAQEIEALELQIMERDKKIKKLDQTKKGLSTRLKKRSKEVRDLKKKSVT